jgi:hypothetical protein
MEDLAQSSYEGNGWIGGGLVKLLVLYNSARSAFEYKIIQLTSINQDCQ